MNKEQWAALCDFCEANACTKYDVLKALKENGTIDRNTKLTELHYFIRGNSYEDMQRFLEENLF